MNNVLNTNKRAWLAAGIIIVILIADQALKIWVKTNFYLGESLEIGSKLLLTVMRIVTVAFLVFYIARVYNRKEASTGYIVCLSLIVAGAAGNIIDCVFYGLVFNNPMPPYVASLFPAGGGYGTIFHGLVVDMFYFPLCEWNWPEWMPWIGGEHFIFFRPVFNLADAAITVGMAMLILFYSSQISEVPWRKKSQLATDKKSDSENTNND